MNEPQTFYLVNGTSAEEVARRTDLRAWDTPLGALVEKPRPFNLAAELEKLDRILHPSRCTCGRYALMHRSDCPAMSWT